MLNQKYCMSKHVLDSLNHVKNMQRGYIEHYKDLQKFSDGFSLARNQYLKTYELINSSIEDITKNLQIMQDSMRGPLYTMVMYNASSNNINQISKNSQLMREPINNPSMMLLPYVSAQNNIKNLQAIHQQNTALQNIANFYRIFEYSSFLNYKKREEDYKRRYKGRYSEDLENFLKVNCWMMPDLVSDNFIDAVVDCFNNDSDIDSIFVDYFSQNNFENLSSLINKWTEESLICTDKLNLIKKT